MERFFVDVYFRFAVLFSSNFASAPDIGVLMKVTTRARMLVFRVGLCTAKVCVDLRYCTLVAHSHTLADARSVKDADDGTSLVVRMAAADTACH